MTDAEKAAAESIEEAADVINMVMRDFSRDRVSFLRDIRNRMQEGRIGTLSGSEAVTVLQAIKGFIVICAAMECVKSARALIEEIKAESNWGFAMTDEQIVAIVASKESKNEQD